MYYLKMGSIVSIVRMLIDYDNRNNKSSDNPHCEQVQMSALCLFNSYNPYVFYIVSYTLHIDANFMRHLTCKFINKYYASIKGGHPNDILRHLLQDITSTG